MIWSEFGGQNVKGQGHCDLTVQELIRDAPIYRLNIGVICSWLCEWLSGISACKVAVTDANWSMLIFCVDLFNI